MKTIELNIDEATLIAALKNGDREAFSILVARYQIPIIRICRGYTGSDEDAKDLAQEVFIDLYRSVGKFKGESKLSTWLFRIAVNRSLNYIRDNRNKINLSWRSGFISRELIDRPDESLNSENETINIDHRKALHQSLNKLPEKQRTAFILNKYEDLSYLEVAQIMKLSQSSVESLIFRAKQNLQKSLHSYYLKNFS